ncbi:hypothetical protein IHE44_0006139 [Lamprotornis superbus]|uniref:Dynein light chain n=1 Tax=Lamprotornis superbus TaxID=245042 RepID=A0A835U110_9PASS|nr:hypothetical protein IHE44_0006139 [Lamprotornis superbus]
MAIPAIMSDRKAVIKNADMSEEMQQDSVECATQALEKYNIEKDIAAHIKKEFDKKYNPTWHCIVGRNFGSYVTHETKHFIYFYLGQVAILLFKSGSSATSQCEDTQQKWAEQQQWGQQPPPHSALAVLLAQAGKQKGTGRIGHTVGLSRCGAEKYHMETHYKKD